MTAKRRQRKQLKKTHSQPPSHMAVHPEEDQPGTTRYIRTPCTCSIGVTHFVKDETDARNS